MNHVLCEAHVGGEAPLYNSKDYIDVIINREMFNLCIKSSKKLEQVIKIEDGVVYYKKVTLFTRK